MSLVERATAAGHHQRDGVALMLSGTDSAHDGVAVTKGCSVLGPRQSSPMYLFEA